ncbi:cytochrome c3 family protein [Desulforhopalus singaporensis]|uniref:C(7)-type cytochrome triheme domain-containing protein n=1 Tax=Desulforhopalus singaporensis TaxID=91360 RepID=A0A1H0N5V5_9BACT|nr:cytochrome c3 family protein [Desulforhopalus singaporensis]SDO87780.1 c(7)-type cytochrome triheme domain-containing protein [Desulforhopalus singaporensis]
MKKILLLLVFGVFLLSSGMLLADNEGMEEEYDEDIYGPEEPIVWVKPVESVVFEHKVHTMGAELDCESCHDDLFAMEAGAAEENEDFTMATLYEGGYCGACHDGSSAFASNTRCTTCHIGVRGHMRLIGGDGDEGDKH